MRKIVPKSRLMEKVKSLWKTEVVVANAGYENVEDLITAEKKTSLR